MDLVRRNTLQVILLVLAVPLLSYLFATSNSTQQHLINTGLAAMFQNLDQPVDVMIIGGGPAGLSAATTLYRHQHSLRIFDHGRPRNSWDTSTRALPGFEGVKPSEFREMSKKELNKTGLVDFVSEEVQDIQKRDDELFYIKTSDGKEWSGRKVLLAMGVHFQFLDIPGYEDSFPERIFHCLFTFGYEHKGSTSAGILAVGFAGSPFHANILVDDARKFASKITVYTNGDDALAHSIRTAAPQNDTIYDSRKIERFTKLEHSILIEFEDGVVKEEDFLVHQPGTKVNPSFVNQLGLDLNERGDIVTKMPFYHTNVDGVFAAGDCASPFKIISNAILMGANAGAGIARQLPTRVTGNVINRLS